MTVDIRSRVCTATITILDSAEAVISGPHTVTEAIAATGLSIEFPQFESQSPNGWTPWRAELNLLADAQGVGLNLDPRSQSGSPSGGALLAQGNRVDIQIAQRDRVTLGTVCPPLYILKVTQALNLPERTVQLSLGDKTLLEGQTPEGERAGFSRGTQTSRHTIVNNYLNGSGIDPTADTLTRYPLTVPPQKTSANNWASEAGKVTGSAGAYGPWIDNTGATRITDIDFAQAAPALSLSIGPGADEVGPSGWRRENGDIRPPRKLTCIGQGAIAVELINPSPIDRTIPADGYTALRETGGETWTFGINSSYALSSTTREAEKIILPEVRTLSSGQVTGLAPNPSTALRDSLVVSHTIDYDNIRGHKLSETITERIPRAKAGGNAYEASLGDTTSDALSLLTKTTVISYEYDAFTGYMNRRTTVVAMELCRFEWTGDRPQNYNSNRFLVRDSERITETWEKAQGNTFGGSAEQPQLWRYVRDVLRPQGVIEPDYVGINAENLVADGRADVGSLDVTGVEYEPPRPEYQQEEFSRRNRQYSGSALFTPVSGEAHKNKEDNIRLSGPIVSNDQCSFLAQLLGLFRHGRSLGATFVGEIPDWLFTGYYPGARIDVTDDGVTSAYLLDGWSISIDQTSAVWGCALVFVGVVGATPDVITPPVNTTIPLSLNVELPRPDATLDLTALATPLTLDVELPALDTGLTAVPITPLTLDVELPALDTTVATTTATPLTLDVELPALDTTVTTATSIPLTLDVELPALDTGLTVADATTVQLFLEFEGTNGSTTFTDSSPANRATSNVGAGTTITTAQFAVGTSSGDFDGVNSAIEYADSTDFTCAGDFTIRCHVRATDFSATDGGANRCVWSLGSLSTAQPGLLWSTTGQLLFFAGATRITSSAIALNTWAEIELTRTGGTYELLLDNVSQGTWANTTTVDPALIRIGASVATPTGNHAGQIDHFEFIN